MATRRSPVAYGGLALGLLALLSFGGLAVASFLSQRPVEVGLVGGELRPCEATSNCVCSEGGVAAIEPFAFDGAAEDAHARLLALLDATEGAEVVLADPLYVHAVFRSKLFKFADDVEFRIDAEAGFVHVRSASRVGRSDLGANAKRVADLRARWNG